MQIWLKQFVSPPVFEDDPGKTAVAKTLNTITLFLLVMGVLIVFVATGISGSLPPEPLLIVLLFVGLLGVKHLVKKGHITAASWLIFVVIWMTIELAFVSTGGVQAPSYSLLLFLVVLAGVLLGWRAALGVTLLNGAVGLLFLWADSQGKLPYSSLPEEQHPSLVFPCCYGFTYRDVVENRVRQRS